MPQNLEKDASCLRSIDYLTTEGKNGQVPLHRNFLFKEYTPHVTTDSDNTRNIHGKKLGGSQ